jgi:hypothetical protein
VIFVESFIRLFNPPLAIKTFHPLSRLAITALEDSGGAAVDAVARAQEAAMGGLRMQQ